MAALLLPIAMITQICVMIAWTRHPGLIFYVGMTGTDVAGGFIAAVLLYTWFRNVLRMRRTPGRHTWRDYLVPPAAAAPDLANATVPNLFTGFDRSRVLSLIDFGNDVAFHCRRLAGGRWPD